MAQLVSCNDARGAVGQTGRGRTQANHERQAVEADAPQQDGHHDRDEHGVQVNDDVVSPSLLEGFRVAGLTEHQFDEGIDAEEQHERKRHVRATGHETARRDHRRQQAPQVGHPRPTVAHQRFWTRCDL